MSDIGSDIGSDIDTDALRSDCIHASPAMLGTRVHLLCDEVDRLRAIVNLAADALAELDAQPELAHPDAVWYTGGALRAALEADRG